MALWCNAYALPPWLWEIASYLPSRCTNPRIETFHFFVFSSKSRWSSNANTRVIKFEICRMHLHPAYAQTRSNSAKISSVILCASTAALLPESGEDSRPSTICKLGNKSFVECVSWRGILVISHILFKNCIPNSLLHLMILHCWMIQLLLPWGVLWSFLLQSVIQFVCRSCCLGVGKSISQFTCAIACRQEISADTINRG